LELDALHKDPNISNLISARLRKVRVNVAFSNMPQSAGPLAQVCMVNHKPTHKIGMEDQSRLMGTLLKFGIFFRSLTFSLNGLIARRSAKNHVSLRPEHHCQLHLTGQVL
jgi:hypothetical protein